MELFLIVAPSSAGKDELLNGVLNVNKGVKPIVSTTSRSMRVGETDGVSYNFVSKDKAQTMLDNGEFLENRSYIDKKGEELIYGIVKDSVDLNSDNKYLTIVDYDGLLQLKERLKYYTVKITSFYVDCSLQERLKRSISREGRMNDEQALEVCRRALDDDIKVVIGKNDCDYILTNERDTDFMKCVLIVDNIINKNKGDN